MRTVVLWTLSSPLPSSFNPILDYVGICSFALWDTGQHLQFLRCFSLLDLNNNAQNRSGNDIGDENDSDDDDDNDNGDDNDNEHGDGNDNGDDDDKDNGVGKW